MSAYTNRGKTTVREEEQWVKNNIDRKVQCTLRRTVSKNLTTTEAQVTAELNLEECVSTKTVRFELHKSNIHSTAAIAKPLITESNI
jgi:hypothetical protein